MQEKKSVQSAQAGGSPAESERDGRVATDLPGEVSLTRLDDKRRVVIPKDICEAAGIGVGTRMVVFGTRDRVVLRKAKIVLEDAWRRVSEP